MNASLIIGLMLLAAARFSFAQADPASEPAVLAVARVLPAVVNINTERVVRRTVRDPFEDFYAQFFGYNRVRPREIRQTLIVVGNAVGYGSSISRGVLSAVKRNITVDDVEYKDLVQTDAAINPGNSGGPVIDLSGRLVGISSAKMAFTPQGVPTQGLGFAIPAEVVRDSVNRFKKMAQKRAGSKNEAASVETSVSNAEKLFGMQLQNLSQELSDALGYARGRGVLITAVEPGSPADEAAIERGMVVYGVGKSDVSSVQQVEALLAPVQTGTNVNFTVGVMRAGGQNRELGAVSLTAR